MMQFNHNDEPTGLPVDDTAKAYLLEAGRWGKFISIFGIVMCGLMVMGGLFFALTGFAGAYSSMGFPTTILGVIYMVGALIYLYPFIALLRFSIRVKEAIVRNDGTVLHSSFRFLKNHFKSIGVLIIVMIFLYALMFLFLVVMGGVAALSS